ncbi:MAG: glycosyltransferase [Cyclobacteriaceae bacterium]|nr:glycosyltransferase [Cyclobacteriaceae bacterium]
MSSPLVSIVCLCYNQGRFVEEAVQSALQQTYPNIEVLVVDDASTDDSAQRIRAIAANRPSVKTLFLKTNHGHCRAFNKAYGMVTGDFIVDLAADDVLLPERVAIGVSDLEKAGSGYGVHFSDAGYIDASGKHLFNHSDNYPHETIPLGDIYIELIRRYFICPPTMLFRRSVLEALGGYDESLSFEDFDFWIRSSRQFSYAYSPKVLVKKRVVTSAQNRRQFRFFSRESATTYKVCEKIMKLNRSRAEQEALSKRVLYEMRLNTRLLNFGLVKKYFQLWNKNRELVYPE